MVGIVRWRCQVVGDGSGRRHHWGQVSGVRQVFSVQLRLFSSDVLLLFLVLDALALNAVLVFRSNVVVVVGLCYSLIVVLLGGANLLFSLLQDVADQECCRCLCRCWWWWRRHRRRRSGLRWKQLGSLLQGRTWHNKGNDNSVLQLSTSDHFTLYFWPYFTTVQYMHSSNCLYLLIFCLLPFIQRGPSVAMASSSACWARVARAFSVFFLPFDKSNQRVRMGRRAGCLSSYSKRGLVDRVASKWAPFDYTRRWGCWSHFSGGATIAPLMHSLPTHYSK